MGTEIVRVPHGFEHPADDSGHPIPGAHLELLYRAGPENCVCYQLYENVSEGTPISPAFEMLTELSNWLYRQGWSDETVSFLLENGHAPSLIIRL
jgi:hypothetical protein